MISSGSFSLVLVLLIRGCASALFSLLFSFASRDLLLDLLCSTLRRLQLSHQQLTCVWALWIKRLSSRSSLSPLTIITSLWLPDSSAEEHNAIGMRTAIQ